MKYTWDKPISKILTMSLTSCFGNIFSDDSVSKMTLSIDIVVGGNYGQGKFGMFLNLF